MSPSPTVSPAMLESEISEPGVSSTTAQLELENLMEYPNEIEPFPSDFDEGPVHNRYKLCGKSILATLGTKVKTLPETVPSISALYRVSYGDNGIGDGVMRAIKCETTNSIDVYVSVQKYESRPLTSWVIVQGEEDELLEILSPWDYAQVTHYYMDDPNASPTRPTPSTLRRREPRAHSLDQALVDV